MSKPYNYNPLTFEGVARISLEKILSGWYWLLMFSLSPLKASFSLISVDSLMPPLFEFTLFLSRSLCERVVLPPSSLLISGDEETMVCLGGGELDSVFPTPALTRASVIL